MSAEIVFTSENTLVQQCYEQLQNDIIAGVLKPGEKLKVERLKERFNVGQSPVREALSRLSAFGLVEAKENKGFRVARVSEVDIRDTYAMFTSIENMALDLAIKHGDDAWESAMVAALHSLSLAEGKDSAIHYPTWAERNYNFHVALISGCGSPILLDIRRHLYMRFDRYCHMAYQIATENVFTTENLVANHEEHKKMVAAMLGRDSKKVQELMSYHINANLEAIIQKLRLNNLI